MKLTVIGTGYVGLCQGAAFAEEGHHVTCVDIDERKVKMLNDFCAGLSEELPIFEPGLDELIRSNSTKGRIMFTTNLKDSIEDADAVFITVGTPPKENGEADLTALRKVSEDIGSAINNSNKDYFIVATKSTVPVGTHKIVEEIISGKTDKQVDIVSNPEFLAQGRAVRDCLNPSRIVIGTGSERARKIMLDIYKPYQDQGFPIYLMSNVDAELHKYAANSYLAAQISLTNNFANLAKVAGGDWNRVKEGILADTRIGKFVNSSPGFGGSCFEKDVEQLTHTFEQYDVDCTLLKEVLRQNKIQKQLLAKRIKGKLGDLKGKTIAVWGLAFKAETDDMRGAPSIPLIEGLIEAGAKIRAYDPVAVNESRKVFGNFEKKDSICYTEDKYSALEGSDALAIVTEWKEFVSADLTRVKQLLRQPVIFDGKDLFKSEEILRYGFYYSSIGKPDIRSQ
ncbi:MAG: UDP-glucose/GDP-mannose dehydrogenase family protein [Nanoarchaeota archaeon]